jgi:hypothetical protein
MSERDDASSLPSANCGQRRSNKSAAQLVSSGKFV